MVLQKKETGTQVDFGQAREIKLNYYTFQNDKFGVLGTQISPVTVSATVRDAFLSGNLADIQGQASGQGMTAPYLLMTWNETQQSNGYLVTDLVIGIVGISNREYNTGPSYLLDSAKAIAWFNNFVKAFGINWKSWLLLSQPLHTSGTENVSTWTWDGTSSQWGESAPIDEPIPNPPAISEVQSHFVNDGQIATSLGEFTKAFLDKGYTITLLGYTTWVCYERSVELRSGYNHYILYKTHTRLTVDYLTNAPVDETVGTTRRLLPLYIIAAIAAAIFAISIGIAAGAYQFLTNLSKTEKHWENWAWVWNPNTNQYEWRITSQGSQTGPPDWFAWVIPIVVLGVGAMLIIRLIPSRKGERNE